MTVISEPGMRYAERDEDQIPLRDVHIYVSVLAKPLQPRLRMLAVLFSNIQYTSVIMKDLFGKCLPGYLVREPFCASADEVGIQC